MFRFVMNGIRYAEGFTHSRVNPHAIPPRQLSNYDSVITSPYTDLRLGGGLMVVGSTTGTEVELEHERQGEHYKW